MYQLQVSFGEAISRGFRKYCCFTGRASRSEFWWFFLFTNLLYCVAMFISIGMNYSSLSVIAENPDYTSSPEAINALISLYTIPWILSLALLLPTLGLLFRRLHDAGHSGWWWLFGSIVPVIGGIVILVFTLQPSQMFDNRYGPVPNLADSQLPPPFIR